MTKLNHKNDGKREDMAAMAAMLLVFGAPFLGILNIIDSFFGVLLVAGVVVCLVLALKYGIIRRSNNN